MKVKITSFSFLFTSCSRLDSGTIIHGSGNNFFWKMDSLRAGSEQTNSCRAISDNSDSLRIPTENYIVKVSLIIIMSTILSLFFNLSPIFNQSYVLSHLLCFKGKSSDKSAHQTATKKRIYQQFHMTNMAALFNYTPPPPCLLFLHHFGLYKFI
jgi:hypothetical protein